MWYKSKMTHKIGCLILNVRIWYCNSLRSRITSQNLKLKFKTLHHLNLYVIPNICSIALLTLNPDLVSQATFILYFLIKFLRYNLNTINAPILGGHFDELTQMYTPCNHRDNKAIDYTYHHKLSPSTYARIPWIQPATNNTCSAFHVFKCFM